MYIEIDEGETGAVRLVDPETFTEFKVVLVSGAADRAGRLDGDHVWVPADLVRELAGDRGGDPQWLEGFSGMCEYAKSKGWVDDSGAIRAHVEPASVA